MWAPIPGFPGYEASDDGCIRSPRKVLKPFVNSHGYGYVTLRRDGESHRMYVHRAVLLTFVSPPPAGADACHNDGNQGNNHLGNLRWGTRSDNVRDAVRHGTHNNARKTHCKRGHEFTPENTYRRDGQSRRQCVTCTKASAMKSYYARKKAS